VQEYRGVISFSTVRSHFLLFDRIYCWNTLNKPLSAFYMRWSPHLFKFHLSRAEVLSIISGWHLSFLDIKAQKGSWLYIFKERTTYFFFVRICTIRFARWIAVSVGLRNKVRAFRKKTFLHLFWIANLMKRTFSWGKASITSFRDKPSMELQIQTWSMNLHVMWAFEYDSTLRLYETYL